MNRVIVDTSVVSYLLKGHSLAPRYWEYLRGRSLGISFMSVAELYRWPFIRGWGERKIAQLREHLRSYIVFPYDDAMSWEWIAATAVLHRVPLVTHNPSHFRAIEGLEIITALE